MKTILLKGETRSNLGKAATKQVRATGLVPCILYGKKEVENLNFSVYHADFKNLVYTPNTYKVRLDVENTTYDAILQDMQFHPVSEAILHADFLRIDDKTPVILNIPVKVVGDSPGVREGGKLIIKIAQMKVKGLIQDIPDFVEVSIDGVKIGQSVKVEVVSIPNVEILDAAANAILSVKTSRAVAKGMEEPEAAETAEGEEGAAEGEATEDNKEG